MKLLTYTFLVICCVALLAVAWTKEDHEIFRLRDEVLANEGEDVTFYDFVGVKSSASQDEINKAYRKKSRLIHPDKAKQSFIASKSAEKARSNAGSQQAKKKPGVRVSKGPSDSEIRKAVKVASERFARLGIIANILRGSGRERYDHFLKNGFPKWRGTGYYYARYRPGLGSVLLGLFIFGGGAVHYLVLYLSWKRQREFVSRYIRHARRAAWGDDMGIKGIPPLGEAASTSAAYTEGNQGGASTMNRRQRRFQERESKKGKGNKEASGAAPDTAVASSTPSGDKKRVVAENGKALIVDSVGNVYLEEENEEGETEQYLLDVNEIPRPTIKQTVLFQLPLWLYDRAVTKLVIPSWSTFNTKTAKNTLRAGAKMSGSSSDNDDDDNDDDNENSDSDQVSVDTEVPSAPNGRARWRTQKRGKGR